MGVSSNNSVSFSVQVQASPEGTTPIAVGDASGVSSSGDIDGTKSATLRDVLVGFPYMRVLGHIGGGSGIDTAQVTAWIWCEP
jgi:hypothetical protein